MMPTEFIYSLFCMLHNSAKLMPVRSNPKHSKVRVWQADRAINAVNVTHSIISQRVEISTSEDLKKLTC